jgi:DNA-binding NtrC family response regulator
VVPPLRDRKDELLAIAQRIIDNKKAEVESSAIMLSSDAMKAILTYAWPGNFRELENRITSGLLKAKDLEITAENIFNDGIQIEPHKTRVADIENLDLDQLNREAVEEALKRANYVQRDAAHLLRISPRALNYRIRNLGKVPYLESQRLRKCLSGKKN